MSEFYAEMAEVARELITEFQQDTLVITRRTMVAASPSRPWDTSAALSPAQHSTPCTVRRVEEKFVDGLRITGTEDQVTFPPIAGFEPSATDVFTVGGRDRTVVDLMRKPAVGTVVAYTVVLAH